MITGIVRSDEARIRMTVFGANGRRQEIDAVVDTGFTAALSLPPPVISALGLPWQNLDRGILADGSECLFDVYAAEVLWDGKVRRLLIDEADSDPLIGMALLRGYELKMEVRTRGKVTIKRIQRR